MGERVVLHPSRPPGVHEAAAALPVPGSVLVSHRWRPDFLTDGLAWIQGLGVEQNLAAARGERDWVSRVG